MPIRPPTPMPRRLTWLRLKRLLLPVVAVDLAMALQLLLLNLRSRTERSPQQSRLRLRRSDPAAVAAQVAMAARRRTPSRTAEAFTCRLLQNVLGQQTRATAQRFDWSRTLLVLANIARCVWPFRAQQLVSLDFGL